MPTLAATIAALATTACGNNSGQAGGQPEAVASATTGPRGRASYAASQDEGEDARTLMEEAASEADTMSRDPHLLRLMREARGIFLVPEFGKGALIVSGRGGVGVVVARDGKSWTPPAFFNIGGIGKPAEVAGSGARIAFLLKDEEALEAFMRGSSAVLNADAGVRIVHYSGKPGASWGKGNVLMWSDTASAYTDTHINLTDVTEDEDKTQAFYGVAVPPRAILQGKIKSAKAADLQKALP